MAEQAAKKTNIMSSCAWADVNEQEKLYHDTEWGVPVHDDKVMFEHLCLECLQCGLSWDLMLTKRAVFRECFVGFDFDRIAAFGEEDVARIMETPNMIRSERKSRAVISNAQAYQKVREEFGSFCDYIWAFTGHKTILYTGHADGSVPVSNGLSARISKDLKKRGFKFVGPVTIYSHMQACGIINDHSRDCPCFARINAANPTVRKSPDEEVL